MDKVKKVTPSEAAKIVNEVLSAPNKKVVYTSFINNLDASFIENLIKYWNPASSKFYVVKKTFDEKEEGLKESRIADLQAKQELIKKELAELTKNKIDIR